MFPIIVPMYRKPATCPHCGKLEKIKEVCAHCQYIYPDEEFPILLGWVPVIGAVLGFIFAGTFIDTYGEDIDILGRVCGAVIGALGLPLVFMIVGAVGVLIYKTISKIKIK